MSIFKKLSFVALAILVFASGCEREDINSTDPNAPAPNAFKVRMTDSPADFEALDVEIVGVEAYLEGEGWVNLNNETQLVSVLELTNGAETTLASQTEGEVQAGVYTMLKIQFGSQNTLQVNESTSLEIGPIAINNNGWLDLQFGGEQEVIIEIDEEVSATSGADILIDFNVAQSIVRDADEFILQPVLTEIENVETGIRGEVSGAANAAVLVTSGDDTLSTFINAEGEFLLRGMEEGMFDLICMPAKELGDSLQAEPVSVEGLVVTEGEITSVGTISF